MADPQSSKTHNFYFLIQIFLRILAIGTTVAAASIMFSNHQTTVVYGVQMKASYSYSQAFKLFAYVNIIALALSVLALLVVAFIIGRKPVNPTYYFLLFLHDLIITVLLMAGFAAAAAIGHVGKHGDSHAGWMPVCDYFGKFCHKTLVALILGFLATILYLILTVVSAKRSRQSEA
ncbi:hypothetical protein ACS0TY_030390 [Phlomoides rotata]